jgi:ABC-type nitrate/sulfonate/bicarbonate transport system substrate-binding protein
MARAERTVRIALPDLVSPSYFPAIAAAEFGLLREEGIELQHELIFPVTDAAGALRDGLIQFLAGAAHAPLYAFPQWRGAKLLSALSRHTYWFLVVRADLGVARGDLSRLAGLRVGAAPGPDLALRRLLIDAGIDAERKQITIMPVPAADQPSVSFGVTAADALAQGRIDAFWANGMGAEVAVRRGTGSVVIDARRGDGPPEAAGYTFPALMATDETLERDPETAGLVTRAVVQAQQMLRDDPERATAVGERLFPPLEASIIADLIRRDAPFYDPAIDDETVRSLTAFARAAGLLDGEAAFDAVVAPRWSLAR